jgi:putative ATP-dependent endonuclease of OLD family
MHRFRGVLTGHVIFNGNTLLVGGNNVGKSTVCEALDLLLGPERLYRRPVVDEHDFYRDQYLGDDGNSVEIRLEAILIDLSDEARLRFGEHLRRWDDNGCAFVDNGPDGASYADADGVVWALPLIFLGRYDPEEDDFVGETFFAHPEPLLDELDDEARASLGQGRYVFTRAHKRLCGFVYLRALRTGSRALSLQRGSLLDTVLRLPEEGSNQMWLDTLKALKELDPAIGEVEQLKSVRNDMRDRLARFVTMAPGEEATTFFASDLTREHLREVVRLFVATQPSEHLVPHTRQGAGSVNLMVFALLTLIADLKGSRSVIFAMEEPEIALPPHTQRRVTKYVLQEMGQAIVTSHSPYVIEQFEPECIVLLSRADAGSLHGKPIDTVAVRPRKYRSERRQFAEAILARAVVVCEGTTEAAALSAASSALERLRGGSYDHLDLLGVSPFTASGDGDVPRWGPMFKALDKRTYAVFDKQTEERSGQAKADLSTFDKYWESPEKGIERLLVNQTPVVVLRRFLKEVSHRADCPSEAVAYRETCADAEVVDLAYAVLKARKGDSWGYAAMLFDHCASEEEVPEFFRTLLDMIAADLQWADAPTGPLPSQEDDGLSAEPGGSSASRDGL